MSSAIYAFSQRNSPLDDARPDPQRDILHPAELHVSPSNPCFETFRLPFGAPDDFRPTHGGAVKRTQHSMSMNGLGFAFAISVFQGGEHFRNVVKQH